MPTLIQICIVIVTVEMLAIAFMTVYMMLRVDRVTKELSQLTHSVRESVAKVDHFTDEARGLVVSLRDCVAPVQLVAQRFGAVGERAADLSSIILEELELPVFAAAAVARGVRSGATHFLTRIVNRWIHRSSSIPGGNNHEG